MAVNSILSVNGTAYDASQRAGAHILPTGLTRTLEGGYDAFTFWEIPTSPFASYVQGDTVVLECDIDDGNGFVVRFSGIIVDCQTEHGQYGWGHAYTCQSLKFLADRVPVTAVDDTGTQVYNRSPLDDYYNLSDAGLELGEIITRILTIPATAQALNAVGIGNYTGLPSGPVLPAATVADLALLTVVPPRPVIIQGEGVFNCLDQEVQQWMPKFFSEIEPDGTIRWKDTTDLTAYFPAQTITCPSATAGGDPVTTPRVQRSTSACFTRLVLRGGPDVEVAILSLVDGTLAEVFTSTDKTNWNLTFFTAPKGSSDFGSVTAVTSTSATLQSHDNTVTWATNFWSGKNATISLSNSIGSLIDQFETRIVTSNNALSAGGTSTVNWDSTWPITATGYDKYRITGGSGGLTDCWRTYTPREPLTGNTGLDTFVGSHLVIRSAHVVEVATFDQTFGVNFTTATIRGGSLGQDVPAFLQVVPSEGMFRFTQPTVSYFGQTSSLNTGSPTDAAHGLPIDVVVYALYSRGPLSVTVPADIAGVPQYQGTAFTEDGIELTKYLDYPQWLWANDTTSFAALAQQVLDTISNAEVDLDIGWYLTPGGASPAWDFLSFGYSLNVDIAGQSSPWSSLNAPIRQISLKWDWTGQSCQSLSFHASTRRRAFSGFDLYIHPEFAQGTALTNAFTEENSSGNWQQANDAMGISIGQRDPRGNFAQVNAALAAGQGPQVTTASDVINAATPKTGSFSMQDTLNAGRDTGGGVQDNASDPRRRSLADKQESLASADHESPLERRTRETDKREASKAKDTNAFYDAQDAKEKAQDKRQQAKEKRDDSRNADKAEKIRSQPDTALDRPKTATQKEDDRNRGLPHAESMRERNRIANVGRQGSSTPSFAGPQARQQASPAEQARIANLGNHPADVSAYSAAGLPHPGADAAEEQARISGLGVRPAGRKLGLGSTINANMNNESGEE